MTNRTDTSPKVWIADLAAYNNGKLHGQWVDLEDGVDAFDSACADVLRTSPEPDAEELEVHDHECIGADVGLGEARAIAAWLEDAPTHANSGEWFARAMVACSGSLQDVLENGAHDDRIERVQGPFQYEFRAREAAEDAAWQEMEETVPDFETVRMLEFVTIDYRRAAEQWFTIDGSDGAWYFMRDE